MSLALVFKVRARCLRVVSKAGKWSDLHLGKTSGNSEEGGFKELELVAEIS